jgi:hypothetical protein
MVSGKPYISANSSNDEGGEHPQRAPLHRSFGPEEAHGEGSEHQDVEGHHTPRHRSRSSARTPATSGLLRTGGATARTAPPPSRRANCPVRPSLGSVMWAREPSRRARRRGTCPIGRAGSPGRRPRDQGQDGVTGDSRAGYAQARRRHDAGVPGESVARARGRGAYSEEVGHELAARELVLDCRGRPFLLDARQDAPWARWAWDARRRPWRARRARGRGRTQ